MNDARSLRVLVVEDDPGERWVLSEILRSRGHTVTACGRGEVAWERFQEDPFPLVLLDWILPGTDGLELSRRIRRSPSGDATVIVVVTGRDGPDDLEEVLGAGADDYVTKPLEVGLMNVRLAVAERRVEEVRGRRALLTGEEARRLLALRSRELEALCRISGIVAETRDLDRAYDQILGEVQRMTGSPYAAVEHVDEAWEIGVARAARGLPEERPDEPLEISLAGTPVGEAVRSGEPAVEADLPSRREGGSEFLVELGLRSYVAVPIVLSGRVVGTLDVAHTEPDATPDAETLKWLETVANTIAVLLDRTWAHEALVERERQHGTASERLREATDELEAFAHSVSHDLRTPLRTMQGFAHALLQDYGDELPAGALDYARRVLASGARAEELIRDLLEYGRLGLEELRLERVSLHEVVEAALAEVRSEVEEREARIETDLGPSTVTGHATALVRVVTNLLGNALKFVPPGRAPRIRIESRREAKGRIRLYVEDNGIGVPPDQRERIFRVFERLSGDEDRPGTGIGLAIVRQAVTRMGGTVGVESEGGAGSRFWIELAAAPRRRKGEWESPRPNRRDQSPEHGG